MSDPEKASVIASLAKRHSGAFAALKPAQEKICGQCGAAFRCGPEEGKDLCWCHDLPHVSPPAGKGHDCLCPDCLRTVITQGRPSGGNPEKA